MDTKKLRELATDVVRTEGGWRTYALALARAVLSEVPEASEMVESSERDVVAYVDKRVAEMEARLDMEQQQRAEGRCRDKRAREGVDSVIDSLMRIQDRLAKLEEARLDRPEPGEPDPLESAKAHVAEWPDWKVKAAREQLPTQDMHGKPMPSPIVTANAPPGFEVVSEPYVYGPDEYCCCVALYFIEGRLIPFGKYIADGQLLSRGEGEHWIAPIGRPKP